MTKRVLVTGANGQLGKTIEELYAINSLGLDFTFASKENLDITTLDGIDNYFNQNFFDYCINCAAYTNVEQAEKTPDPAYKVNAEGVKNLSEMCLKHQVVLIHISTDYVFDGEKKEPYTVFDKPNPINEYGKSKLLGEQYIQEILSEYFIVRTSWLYSKKYGNNFYRNILKKAKQGEKLKITTDQIGCPTNTENLSRYLLKLITNKSIYWGVRHFSDDEVMTWYDFTKQILLGNDLINKVNLVKTGNYITFAQRPKYSVLKLDKI